jgi:hypothetical protein
MIMRQAQRQYINKVYCILLITPQHPLNPTNPYILHHITLGIAGDSNVKCLNSKSLQASGYSGEVGSPCTSDLWCIYGMCKSGVCAAPPLVCPTDKIGQFNDLYRGSRNIILHTSYNASPDTCVVQFMLLFAVISINV